MALIEVKLLLTLVPLCRRLKTLHPVKGLPPLTKFMNYNVKDTEIAGVRLGLFIQVLIQC